MGIAVFLGTIFYYINSRNEEESADKDQEVIKEKIDKRFIYSLRFANFMVDGNKIKEGETMSDILLPAGVSYSRINNLMINTNKVFDLRNMRSGNNYFLFFNKDSVPELKYMVYEINKIDYVKYEFGDSISASLGHRKITRDTILGQGEINSSLWSSMQKDGLDPNLALSLSEIYAWTIDFYGIQKGDKYKVVYVVNYIDSTYIGIEKILSAKFTNAGINYYSFIYKQDGAESYFDEKGQSLKRAFLKAPLKFARISSTFSNSRMHPILKIRRPHYGVDYAAPSGTPIMSIGNGKILTAGWSGGYGRRIVIKHNSNYTTGYAHLSHFGNGIRAGTFVKQGQIIGYVGMSGLATGPHLDFRIYNNGKPIDPLRIKSPPAIPIYNENKADFLELRDKWMNQLK